MSQDNRWTAEQIGDQSGRVAIVTGANTGIGFETARALVTKGARVILACRSQARGQEAVDAILELGLPGRAELGLLDLSSLDSVRNFASRLVEQEQRLDLLVNNAGVMVPPESKTAEGFELQFGVNHVGHFALTLQLLPLLARTPGARVVTVSSGAHRFGNMNFDDLNWASRSYNAMRAYGQSKLANLLFTSELQRRLEEAGADTIAVAAHPGWTATDLQRNAWIARLFNPFVAMGTVQGALPTLRAAVDPEARGDDYFGPNGFYEMRGYPHRVDRSDAAKRDADARRLWQVSEELTGIRFDQLANAA